MSFPNVPSWLGYDDSNNMKSMQYRFLNSMSLSNVSHYVHVLLKQYSNGSEIRNKRVALTSQHPQSIRYPIISTVILSRVCIRLTTTSEKLTWHLFHEQRSKSQELPPRWRDSERAQCGNVTCIKGLASSYLSDLRTARPHLKETLTCDDVTKVRHQ